MIEAALKKTLDAVDHLVVRLDELDEDPDLEESGDEEPSLGVPADGDSQVS